MTSSSWPAAAIAGRDTPFPVHRILCIGRNYAAHVEEMGNARGTPPTYFTKSPPALHCLPSPGEMTYPPCTEDLHHEVELVVALQSGGHRIPKNEALHHVLAIGVGLDMTRRDLQRTAKASRTPWAAAKDFDQSAICGLLMPTDPSAAIAERHIQLTVNGHIRQHSPLSLMVWSVPDIIAYLSTLMTLRAGDLIYTGTPAGVGPVVPGDHLIGTIDGLPSLDVTITPPVPPPVPPPLETRS